MSDGNIYAGPRARILGALPPSGEQEDASRLDRLWAFLIDAFAPAFVVVPVAVLAGVLGLLAHPFQGSHPLLMALCALPFGAWAVWNILLFHRHGQTFGKRQRGIRVVRMDGSRCSVRRWLFLRSFLVQMLGAIPWVGPVISCGGYLLIFREDRRCLHDLVADTRVVRS